MHYYWNEMFWMLHQYCMHYFHLHDYGQTVTENMCFNFRLHQHEPNRDSLNQKGFMGIHRDSQGFIEPKVCDHFIPFISRFDNCVFLSYLGIN